MFQELLSHKSVDQILEFTIAETQRRGDSDVSLSIEELKAFFGQYLLRGVLKRRDKLLTNFCHKEYGRFVFPETMPKNKF